VTPLTITGSFWTRYELREGYAEQLLSNPRTHREGDAFVYRARLGIRTNPVDLGGGQSVSVRFVPQAAGTHSVQGANTVATVTDQPNLGVYEAFVRLQSTGFALDVGRFAMDYGDALVIGNLDWNEFGRAFQGGRMRLSGRSGYYTDVFATLISEGIGQTASIFEGDAYFFGIYTGIGPLLGPLELDVYLLGKTTAGVPDVDVGGTPSDQEGANFFTFGSRVKGKVDIYDYRAEGGVQFGQSPVVGGDALDKLAFQADAGVGISPIRNLRFGLGGLIATGDGSPGDGKDDAWDQLYPTSHKFLGLTDVFGPRTNALSGNAEVHYAPINSLTLALQAHMLSTMVAQQNGDHYSGTELDAHVIHRIGKGTKLRGMYGAFLPNGDVWVDSDPIHYFELQFGYTL
jgi:hypothetical protein